MRRIRLITHQGVTRNMTEWARALGIEPCTLEARLRRGWALDRALTGETQQREKHGFGSVKERNPTYRIWAGIKTRCYDKGCPHYSRWGGRGIAMCDAWKTSFLAFLRDMGPRPSKKHTIDRINNDGNYEPGNCRWATRTEQSRNRGAFNVRLTHDGRTQSVGAWAEEMGIRPSLIHQRLKRDGLSVEEALTRRHRLRPTETGK